MNNEMEKRNKKMSNNKLQLWFNEIHVTIGWTMGWDEMRWDEMKWDEDERMEGPRSKQQN